MAYSVNNNNISSGLLSEKIDNKKCELFSLMDNCENDTNAQNMTGRCNTNTASDGSATRSFSMVHSDTYLETTSFGLTGLGIDLIKYPVLQPQPNNKYFNAQTEPSLLRAKQWLQQQQHDCGELYCGLGTNYDLHVQNEKEVQAKLNERNQKNVVFRVFKELFNLHDRLNMCLPPALTSTVRNDLPLRADSTTLEPGNMNLQFHVRQAVRKCKMGILQLEREVSDNKPNNIRKYEECDRQLKVMAKLILQLELYKDIVLEHRFMQFVHEEAKGQAIRLHLLLQQLNGVIYKCHDEVKLLKMHRRPVQILSSTTQTYSWAATATSRFLSDNGCVFTDMGGNGPSVPQPRPSFDDYAYGNAAAMQYGLNMGACNNNNDGGGDGGNNRRNGVEHQQQQPGNAQMRHPRLPLRYIG